MPSSAHPVDQNPRREPCGQAEEGSVQEGEEHQTRGHRWPSFTQAAAIQTVEQVNAPAAYGVIVRATAGPARTPINTHPIPRISQAAAKNPVTAGPA